MDEEQVPGDSRPTASSGGFAVGSPVAKVSAASEMHDSKQSPKKKRKSPAVPWKKPKDMPKRPLSAYNLFFREERERLVVGAGSEAEETGIVPRAESVESSPSSPEKKKAAKTSGIGFARLAQIVAEKWKNLEAEKRAPYEEQASREKASYDDAIAKWRVEQKAKADDKAKLDANMGERAFASMRDSSGPPSIPADDYFSEVQTPYPVEWFQLTSSPLRDSPFSPVTHTTGMDIPTQQPLPQMPERSPVTHGHDPSLWYQMQQQQQQQQKHSHHRHHHHQQQQHQPQHTGQPILHHSYASMTAQHQNLSHPSFSQGSLDPRMESMSTSFPSPRRDMRLPRSTSLPTPRERSFDDAFMSSFEEAQFRASDQSTFETGRREDAFDASQPPTQGSWYPRSASMPPVAPRHTRRAPTFDPFDEEMGGPVLDDSLGEADFYIRPLREQGTNPPSSSQHQPPHPSQEGPVQHPQGHESTSSIVEDSLRSLSESLDDEDIKFLTSIPFRQPKPPPPPPPPG